MDATRQWLAGVAKLEAALESAGSALDHAGRELYKARREQARLLELSQSFAQPLPVGRLTWSERRVAYLAASGLTDDQVAEELHLSRNTVKTHMKTVLRKLGLRSRWQVADVLAAQVSGGHSKREEHARGGGISLTR
jgi:DNA-binding NarL/FixJ family response regulator